MHLQGFKMLSHKFFGGFRLADNYSARRLRAPEGYTVAYVDRCLLILATCMSVVFSVFDKWYAILSVGLNVPLNTL